MQPVDRRRAVCAALLIAMVWGTARESRAVVIAQLVVPSLINADVPVLPSGVLIFRYDGGTYDPQLDPNVVVITVQSDSGEPVDGALEELTSGGELLPTRSTLRIWRPAQPFRPGARYTVTMQNTETGESGEEVFETHSSDPPRSLQAAHVELALYAELGDSGEATACCEREDGVEPHCFSPLLVPEPRVSVAVSSSADPALRQLLVDVSPAGFDAESDPIEFIYSEQLFEAVPFAERRDRYCVRFEVYDAVSRARGALREMCVDDEPRHFDIAQAQPVPEYMLYDDLAASGCHVPPAGYEYAWCTTNEAACMFDDSDGCQRFFEVCPHYQRPSRPNGGAQPEPVPAMYADGGEPFAGDADEDPQLRTAGCGCEVKRGAAPAWVALLALAIPALMHRRRRVTRS